MGFIDRNSLPPILKDAYDKAARGDENDTSRTNDKNDEKKIDSELELSIFRNEVQKLFDSGKIDKYSYDSVNKSINSVFNKIDEVKDSIYAKMRASEEEKVMNKFKDRTHKRKEAFKQNHPILSYIDKLLNTDYFYNKYKDKEIPICIMVSYQNCLSEEEVKEKAAEILNQMDLW